MVMEYLKEAKNTSEYLIIVNKNTSKNLIVKIIGYDNKKAFYIYKSSGIKGEICISNIESINFVNQHRDAIFRASHSFPLSNPCKHYYLTEIKNSDETQNELKLELFEKIFDSLNNTNNLLQKYLKNEKIQINILNDHIPILLDKSNKSQKDAISNAIANEISIIEGPPGTGKTTTILSLIANFFMLGKKVIVVSKNNSAVDNIIEEYEKLDIPPFYVRFGESKEIMPKLQRNADSILNNLKNDFSKPSSYNFDTSELLILKEKLASKEKQLHEYMILSNSLKELKNQNRYMSKKMKCYQFDKIFSETELKHLTPNLGNFKNINQVIYLSKKEKLHFWNKIFIKLKYHLDTDNIEQKLINLKHILGEIYLNKEIAKLEKNNLEENIKNLKNEIASLYAEYNSVCKKAFHQNLTEIISTNLEKIDNSPNMHWQTKLYNAFPVILTTADAFLFNFKTLIENNNQVDCIIIDEATQCDIVTGLPLLFLAKQLVVVGDIKQLSAITSNKENPFSKYIDSKHQQKDNSFLKSIQDVFDPPSKLLKEHYRCDFNIINFCNKFYYNNDLQIYTDSNYDSMKIVNVNTQKACDKGTKSYFNEREIITLQNLTKTNDLSKTFFITPFTAQGKLLKDTFLEKNAGTIHTFQGKGNDFIYFDTVFNDLEMCRKNIKSRFNMFTNELINVAVSRAKKQFILVGDIDFFKKYPADCKEIKHLIDYIEIYGEKIKDTTVCMYDNLYKNIPYYTKTKDYDNEYEEKLHKKILSILETNPNFQCYLKLPLTEFVLDKNYLNKNIELKNFILSDSHADFTIIDERIHKPVLVIELDGGTHKTPEQQIRDQKKDTIMKHLKIPILRLGSKEILKLENLDQIIPPYFI